jgi:hypothetical protein
MFFNVGRKQNKMKPVMIVAAISGVVSLACLATTALSLSTAGDLKNRLINSCTCTTQGDPTNDCNMTSAAKSGYLASIFSLILSIVNLILILVLFAVSASPRKP